MTIVMLPTTSDVSKKKKPSNSYERARKRVKDIKGFYGHLAAYIIINLIVLFSRARFLVISKGALGDPDFLNWIDWNTYGTPIIWGIGLGIHALTVVVKNPYLGKAWEDKQIEKYMNKDK
mgnify:CR=1 FL=1